MADNNLGASFSIDITNLKAGLAQANRLIRDSESEFRAAAAGMDDWTNSAEGLTARSKTLNSQIDIQKTKINALLQEKERIISTMEQEGKSQEEIERAIDGVNKQITSESKQLDKLKGELDKTDRALNKFESSTDEAGDSADKAGDDAKKAGKKLKDMGDSAKDAGGGLEGLKGAAGVAGAAIAAVGAAAVAAVGSFLGLAESTRESRENMAKLETGFTTAGHSAEAATETYEALYGILGDDGQATEAAAHLAQLTNSQEELAQWTDIATGVYATFGDSLPIENLTEAANETAKTGKITGGLADALNWAGVSEEEFQASLDKCSSEQERQALITKTLNGLYSEAADKYKEVNGDVIAAQEAQAGLNQALNELGAIAEPIMTTLKVLATDLLKAITPFVALIGEGLTGALNGTAGAADTLAEGLGGIFDTLVSTATSMLPTLVNLVATLIPKIIVTLLEQIPSLLQVILDAIPLVLNALSQALPQIVTAIVKIVPQIITALVASIPQILQAGITLLMALVQAVPTVVTSLVDALPAIVHTIVNVVIEAIPMLLDAATQLLLALVDAIPIMIPSLIAAIPQIITSLIECLLEGLPLLLNGAVELLMAIVKAIPKFLPQLVSMTPTIVTTIISTLLKNLPALIQGAIQLFMGIVKAIPEICIELARQVPTIITQIVTSLGQGVSRVAEVGRDLIRGLWNGISDMVSWIGNKIKGFGESVLGGLKDFFGIASPSKVMRDVVGKNLALGVGEGFVDEMGKVGNDMTNALSDAVPTADDVKLDVFRMDDGSIVRTNATPTTSGLTPEAEESVSADMGDLVNMAMPLFIEELKEALPEILKTIKEFFEDKFEEFKYDCKEFFKAITEGLRLFMDKDDPEGFPKIWEKEFIKVLIEKLLLDNRERIEEASKETFGAITDALKDIASEAKLIVKNMITDIVAAIQSGDISGAFSGMLSGLNMGAVSSASIPSNLLGSAAALSPAGVAVYQTNNYSQAHSRYEIYKSAQDTAAAVRVAMGGRGHNG